MTPQQPAKGKVLHPTDIAKAISGKICLRLVHAKNLSSLLGEFFIIMEVNNEFENKAKEAVNNGSLYANIPHRLSVIDRPEFWIFPLNILYSKFRAESDGSQTIGSALYVPDLSTFAQNNETLTMTYRNQYDQNSYVLIAVDTNDMSYRGDKFVNGEGTTITFGKITDENSWKMFFVHLTMQGLSTGERCEFTKIA
jgi:hypothetical protein